MYYLHAWKKWAMCKKIAWVWIFGQVHRIQSPLLCTDHPRHHWLVPVTAERHKVCSWWTQLHWTQAAPSHQFWPIFKLPNSPQFTVTGLRAILPSKNILNYFKVGFIHCEPPLVCSEFMGNKHCFIRKSIKIVICQNSSILILIYLGHKMKYSGAQGASPGGVQLARSENAPNQWSGVVSM